MRENNRYQQSRYGENRSRNFSDRRDTKPKETKEIKEIKALPVPEDYVDAADAVMRQLSQSNAKGGKLTTSKLRNILTLVSDIYNTENRRRDDSISSESAAKLQMLRIRVLYEAGREQSVKKFVEKRKKKFKKTSKLLASIKGVDKNRENMLRFCHYMEALVAYHRFYGGDPD